MLKFISNYYNNMPNWSNSYYRFVSDDTKAGNTQIKTLLENCKKFQENSESDVFRIDDKKTFAYHVLPFPDEWDKDWCCTNWGTKWAESDFRIVNENDTDIEPDGFEITYQTPWCNFSNEWNRTLTDKYPNVKIFVMTDYECDQFSRDYKCYYDGSFVDESEEEVSVEEFKEWLKIYYEDEYWEDEENWDIINDWTDLHNNYSIFVNDPYDTDDSFTGETFYDMFETLIGHFSEKIYNEYIEPKKDACDKIGEWFLKIKYDPSTKYGNKFANELYDENYDDGFGTAYHDGTGFADCDPSGSGNRLCKDYEKKKWCSECVYLDSHNS